ncbi:hypothetical protein ASA1KI_34980 [Opitutales bacterium ASA1]|uniref:DUF255 domain-containing protein n=1 Tax=Congregicoccus parvus TaxID=3081749 RepID=UPI002B2F04BD|nr:hypothetical protein ASA1KI_34980 [Opitutales bacterium ASA1]
MPVPHRLTSLLALLVLPLTALAASLGDAHSAFVRAHADSPIRWQAWGEEAFAAARAQDKPLYVLVGTLTHELARAMREQSFTREETAAIVNESFIPVVVDRDEHPALAAFLQVYLDQAKQMQGWPLNVWLTPELQPFDGATYLPPTDEWGKEGFPNAVRRIAAAWQADPGAQRTRASDTLDTLAPFDGQTTLEVSDVRAAVAEGLDAWIGMSDPENGGFGDPPRRLEPELLRFLLKHDEPTTRIAAVRTFRNAAGSPMRDPLDGGFFRSTGDAAWQAPTLQKTLADQARAALAYQAAGMDDVAQRALDYALSLASPDFGYAAAEDSTTPGVATAFLWTTDQIGTALGGSADTALLERLGVKPEGNLPADGFMDVDPKGKNLPRWTTLPVDQDTDALDRLRIARAKRAQPVRDQPATSGAHGLFLAALARSTEARHTAAASKLAAFVLEKLIRPDGTLRSGPAFDTEASPRDYALVADGLLHHAAATGELDSRRVALALLQTLDTRFLDPDTGRYAAAALPLPPGVALRLPPPAPDAGDLPSVESTTLLTSVTHDLGEPAKRAALAATIVGDIRNSPIHARGDQLLALHAWLATLP